MVDVNVPRLGRMLKGQQEDRRGEIGRGAAFHAGRHELEGFIETTGAGEVLVDVHFPVRFMEKPNMTFGGELTPNQGAVLGNFPTVSVVVVTWDREDQVGGFYYNGCSLGIVTSGPTDMRMFVHWKASGKAFVNPVKHGGTLGEAI